MARRKVSDQVKEKQPNEEEPMVTKGDFSKTLSTGSTWLDLAISGMRRPGGGIPSGILMEIYGPSSLGKTALLSEMGASCQAQGGELIFLDPEGRLDSSYAEIYGVSIDEDNYAMPNTVAEVIDFIYNWEPENPDAINMIGCDSIAALCSKMQMDGTDARGQAAAKELSQGIKKICKKIRDRNWVIAFTNQVRYGDGGESTPGGFAVPFYSSLRIRLGKPAKGARMFRQKKIGNTTHQDIYGIHSIASIKKSSVDKPFREAKLFIESGYGVDDIKSNLILIREITGADYFDCFDKKYKVMDAAISYIEENKLQDKLRERAIEQWENLQKIMTVPRAPKHRW